MKNTLRILSISVLTLLCFGLLAACGAGHEETTPSTTAPATETIAGSEPFVAPPDALGKVVSVDSSIITWNAYAIDDEVIDFIAVDVKELDALSEEPTVIYLEDDISCYLIQDGKLVDAVLDDIQPGAVIGITTLEEGVQDIYILLNPDPMNQTDEMTPEDEIVEDFVPDDEITDATEAADIEETEAE